jgi:hypothetical protein
MTLPKPDRSKHEPNKVKTAENPVVDIGWNEGVLSDGRPYRVEAWAEDGLTSLTYFFARDGLEALSREMAAELLEREGLLTYRSDTGRSAYPAEVADARGHPMWSINVVIADEDHTYAEDHVSLLPYPSRPVA